MCFQDRRDCAGELFLAGVQFQEAAYSRPKGAGVVRQPSGRDGHCRRAERGEGKSGKSLFHTYTEKERMNEWPLERHPFSRATRPTTVCVAILLDLDPVLMIPGPSLSCIDAEGQRDVCRLGR